MPGPYHIHLVSDATGETINGIARACLVQFDPVDLHEHFWSLVRTQRQLDLVLEGIKHWPGIVLFTLVDEALRRNLVDFCRKEKIRCLSVLDPVMNALSQFFGAVSLRDPGRQHILDATYFSRIEAVNFALATDDGNRLENVPDADVVILGVSRTSKTPTCVYLANRGIQAANIPLVPGIDPPLDLAKLDKPLIVGLTKDPESLVDIRRTRMRLGQESPLTDYVDPERVREEVKQARRLFARLGCPVIDVTRRSVEETASEIIMLLTKRALLRETSKPMEPSTPAQDETPS